MKAGFYKILILALAMAVFAVTGCTKKESESTGEAAKKVSWKMASSFSATLPILGVNGVYFTERVEKITSGRIKIKFFDPGKLVPGLEVFDATSKGSIDAGWTAPGYWIGKIPAAAFFAAVPFGPDTSEYMAWMYEGGGLELWQEIYGRSNIMPLPCNIIPPEASGWFREPITSMEQFKGMKIRFYGIGGQAMEKLGASVQLLAGGEIYPALERGVLDATEFSMPSIDRKLGFNKIAKHYYFPGWHQQASWIELMVNMDRWNELSDGDKTLLDAVCRDTLVKGITKGEVEQGPALAAFKEEGVQIHYWPEEMLRGFEKAYAEVVVEMSAKDADFKRVYESYSKFREGYKDWGKLSRLPKGF